MHPASPHVGAGNELDYNTGLDVALIQPVDLQADRIGPSDLYGIDDAGNRAVIERLRGLDEDRSLGFVAEWSVGGVGKTLGDVTIRHALGEYSFEAVDEFLKVLGRAKAGVVIQR